MAAHNDSSTFIKQVADPAEKNAVYNSGAAVILFFFFFQVFQPVLIQFYSTSVKAIHHTFALAALMFLPFPALSSGSYYTVYIFSGC